MAKWLCTLACLLLFGANLAAAEEGYVKGPSKKRVIVFVNGVLGDATSTWTHSNGSYWPRLLTRDPDFADADVYVHTFVSPPIANAQNIEELAGRMADYLTTDGVFHRHEEIIFLCHSMGGLVTRAMLLKSRVDPKKIPMIYFFGTPTGGANIAKLPAAISRNPQFEHMLPLKKEGYLSQLLERWLDSGDDPATNYPNRVQSFCSYEKRDTYGVRIVEYDSAIHLCNRRIRAVLADHIDMVKPEDDKAEPYRYFKAAYLQLFTQSGPIISAGLKAGAFEEKAVTDQLVSAGYSRSDLPKSWVFGPKPALSVHKQLVSIEDEKTISCGETVRGRREVPVKISPDQELIAADITGGGKGFKRVSVSVMSIGERHIDVAYKLVAPDKNSPMCGSTQIVWSELKYVTSRAKAPLGLFDQFLEPRFVPYFK